ncbi:hypothetical protein [Burkholderia pseudomallei]|uniref:hypothetical protein n=1 Tax=Burkholderia pseudomallei TaxID=28450 RepID=UPI000F091144|nr:hypothetical protein [Burkholderia pseudomallei]CAJ3070198.1 Uncharacterised protein [Burkholderia pseudomallei]VCK72991.1 Uncharacterised protein [Burkholderia pseudomallei]VCK79896.1 Uncharacterised protein [Burkholderia pseudomallei]VCK80126.1 Uncharacterised protein [Burkholderia pseudomallei]VCK80879.1 Uncharacterised protein [Burkholderia pseudomallei]
MNMRAQQSNKALSGEELEQRAKSVTSWGATLGLAGLLSLPILNLVIGMFMVAAKFGAILVVSRNRMRDIGILLLGALAAMVGMFGFMFTIETHFAWLAFFADFAFNMVLIKYVWLGALGHATTRMG